MGSGQLRRPCIEGEGEIRMMNLIAKLEAHPQITDYKLNIREKESYELFFVKGALETVRSTDTCDRKVTVYVDHDGYKGDAQFFVYASTTEEQLKSLMDQAVEKALLINNKTYELPQEDHAEYTVESNFPDYKPMELATRISQLVFESNTVEHGGLNAVEIFINKYHDTVINSKKLHKTQIRYDAMVEAIPTYNGETQSVELYEQYNFSSLDENALKEEISRKMKEVKARYEAVTPDFEISGDVILNKLELNTLFSTMAYDLNYASVYSHTNLFKKGDSFQNNRSGDPIGITMKGQVEGCVESAGFDGDGISLDQCRIVEDGKVMNYYGSNRYGQYLGEQPTGNLGCLCVDAGSFEDSDFTSGLEVVSMSGLQVDFYNDYIGGEVRLGYYYKEGKRIPVTGISITGKLRDILNNIRLSKAAAIHDGYAGPEKACLKHMKIF